MAVSGGGDKSNDSNLDAGKKVPYYSLLSFFFFCTFFSLTSTSRSMTLNIGFY